MAQNINGPPMAKNTIMWKFDLFWINLIHFEPHWAILIHIDQVWTSLIHFKHVWSILNKFDQFGSSLNQFDPFWSNLIKFEVSFNQLYTMLMEVIEPSCSTDFEEFCPMLLVRNLTKLSLIKYILVLTDIYRL